MSAAVAVAGPEGIGVGTDSRTTQTTVGPAGEFHRVSSDSAEKLFVLCERFVVATYGEAMVGPRTIRGLIEEFVPPEIGVADFAEALGDFFHAAWADATPAPRGDLSKFVDSSWPLGFLVAGYDHQGTGEIFEVKIRAHKAECTPTDVSTIKPGVVVRGQGDAVKRLLDGVDWDEVDRQRISLDSGSREKLEELRYDLMDPMTTEDAARRARFLVETQIGMQEISTGTLSKPRVPGCGGLVRVATVGTAGAAWVSNAGRPVVSPGRRAAELGPVGEVG